MMPLEDELRIQAAGIFAGVWTRKDAQKVPEPSDLALGNHGADIEAAVLYADLAGSTDMVDRHKDWFSAEIYKTYLMCTARIIKTQGGRITAYDGDRVMALFIGDLKRTTAAITALKINYAVSKILNPTLKLQYPNDNFEIRHTIGVDCSKLMAARIGVKNDNDIVWVGRAANYAAKLANISNDDSVFITKDVFDRMNDSAKIGGSPSRNMWRPRTWTGMNDLEIYSSNWIWNLN